MKLTERELAPLLAQLPTWRTSPERGGTISREFVFHDFAQAIGFICQVAVVAVRRDHHPEWSNVYNRVDVLLTTHDAGGLTALDITLATLADQIHQRMTAPR